MAEEPTRGSDGLAGLNGRDGRDSRPVPDPTVRTDELVGKAVGALREVLAEKIDGQKAVFEARLNGNEEAVKLLQTILDRQPAEVDVKIGHLQSLHDEKIRSQADLINALQEATHEMPDLMAKEVRQLEQVTGVRFEGVGTQFRERDTAVAAALQAAKEAVREQNIANQLANSKAETGFADQIKLLGARIEDSKKSQESATADVKDRLTRIESAAVGALGAQQDARTTHTTSNQNIGVIVGIVGMVVGLIVLLERFVR